MNNAVPGNAYELVKYYEGLHLESYLCPSGICTVGWGTTGAFVKPGLVITQQQAETYLQETLISIANSIPDGIWQSLQEHQRASLISFLYNVGLGALDAPSFGKAIRSNLAEVPLRLLDWDKAIVNGVKQPLLGLTRRRRTEAILWKSGNIVTDTVLLDDWQKVQNILSATVATPQQSSFTPINLVNAAKYFRSEPQQLKAFEWLDTQISAEQRVKFGTLYRALPPAQSVPSLPQKPNPWFIFDHPLGDMAKDDIVMGVLRLKGFPNGDSLTEWRCTSGQPGYQYSGGTKLKGLGPLPGHRYVKDSEGNTPKHYWVSTQPLDQRGVKGIDGDAYHITPDPVLIGGVWRGEFLIHNDSNRLYSPGSAGCIVAITDAIFNDIRNIMQRLREVGYKQIPLEVNH